MSNHEALFGALSGSGSSVGYVLLYLFYGLAIGVVVWGIWYLIKHNIKVNIYGRSFKEVTKGRFIKDKQNGKIKDFELKKYNDDVIGEVTEEHVQPIKKTFGIGKEINLIKDNKGNLRPIKIDVDDILGVVEWEGLESADYKLASVLMQEAIQTYTEDNWWDKYGNIVMQTAMVSVVAVLIIVIVREQSAMVEAFNAGAQQLATTFAQSAQESTTQVINSTQ